MLWYKHSFCHKHYKWKTTSSIQNVPSFFVATLIRYQDDYKAAFDIRFFRCNNIILDCLPHIFHSEKLQGFQYKRQKWKKVSIFLQADKLRPPKYREFCLEVRDT